jgi:MFS family permease
MAAEQLSAQQISAAVFTGGVCALIFEVPSGTIADRFGYRGTLVASQLLRCFAFGVLWYWPTAVCFCIAFFLLALKETFVSGTSEALLFENLRRLQAQAQFLRMLGMDSAFRRLALLVSGLLGAFLLPYGFELLLELSFIAALCGACSACLLPADCTPTRRQRSRSMFAVIRSGLRQCKRNPMLSWHIAFSGLLGGLIGCLWTYWSLLGAEFGLADLEIGLLVAAINLSGMIAGLGAARWRQITLTQMLCLAFAAAGLLLTAAYSFSPISALLLIIFNLGFYAAMLANDALLQAKIRGQSRATVSSFAGLLSSLVQTAAALPLGWIAAAYGLRCMLQGIALLWLLFLLVALACHLWKVKAL